MKIKGFHIPEIPWTCLVREKTTGEEKTIHLTMPWGVTEPAYVLYYLYRSGEITSNYEVVSLPKIVKKR